MPHQSVQQADVIARTAEQIVPIYLAAAPNLAAKVRPTIAADFAATLNSAQALLVVPFCDAGSSSAAEIAKTNSYGQPIASGPLTASALMQQLPSSGTADSSGLALVECWMVDEPVQRFEAGPLQLAQAGDWLAGSLEIVVADDWAAAAEQAYQSILELLQQQATTMHLLRCWNFLSAINQGTGDQERYRQFCLGRARAFASAGMAEQQLPAGTGIGLNIVHDLLQIYFIAHKQPGVAIENPRQVSAFHYPREHGPSSPSFCRAMVTPDAQLLLVSGTASVVGHATAHEQCVLQQLEETLTNLAVLAAASGHQRPLALRVYLREQQDLAIIEPRLRKEFMQLPLIFLHADICRSNLLLEIEGVYARA